MLALSAERGGDPDRAGQEGPARPGALAGAPAGRAVLGLRRSAPAAPAGTSSARRSRSTGSGTAFDVQGGGSDLLFPHHEMSAAHAEVATGEWPFARRYVHAGMIGLDGEKMSKSRGNLVLVSGLRESGTDPTAVRLGAGGRALPAGPGVVSGARWPRRRHGSPAGGRRSRSTAGRSAEPVLDRVRERLADDLDTPAALAAVDRWADEARTRGGPSASAPGLVRDLVDALLGVAL